MTSQPQIPHNLHEEKYHGDHDRALSRLIHDAGMEVAKELVHINPRAVDQVVAQVRAGVQPYGLDFAALGASAEQVERIAAHQAERKAFAEIALAGATPVEPAVRGYAPRGHADHAARSGPGQHGGLGG